MELKYFFRVRVGKQISQLRVDYKGYGGDRFTISENKIVKIPGYNNESFKVNEKWSHKRWPKYLEYKINEDGLQVKYFGNINHIEAVIHKNLATKEIDFIVFEAYFE
jgi:hypothetical protein